MKQTIETLFLAACICCMLGCISNPQVAPSHGMNDTESAIAEFVRMYTCNDPDAIQEEHDALKSKLEELKEIMHVLRGQIMSTPRMTTNIVHQAIKRDDDFPDRKEIIDTIAEVHMQMLRIEMERKALEMIHEHPRGHIFQEVQ